MSELLLPDKTSVVAKKMSATEALQFALDSLSRHAGAIQYAIDQVNQIAARVNVVVIEFDGYKALAKKLEKRVEKLESILNARETHAAANRGSD